MFFPHRSWPALIDAAPAAGLAEAEVAGLHRWLPAGRVDQKRADALAMLAAMREDPAPPQQPGFRFEWTNFWNGMFARERIGDAELDESVLDELRLQGEEVFGRARARALLRLLAQTEAQRRGLEPPASAVRGALARLRSERALFTRAALDGWLAANELDAAALERLAAAQLHIDVLAQDAGASLGACLLDELRLDGSYATLARRARDKRKLTWAAAAVPANSAALRLWFFEQRLGLPLPDDVAAYARRLGFAGLAEFDSALARERLYLSGKSRAEDTSPL
jgi:hypothetical protein